MNQRQAFLDTIEAIAPNFHPMDKDSHPLFDHIIGMYPRITENFSEAKVGRWLGWAQGVACALDWLTLDQCKEINKKNAE